MCNLRVKGDKRRVEMESRVVIQDRTPFLRAVFAGIYDGIKFVALSPLNAAPRESIFTREINFVRTAIKRENLSTIPETLTIDFSSNNYPPRIC